MPKPKKWLETERLILTYPHADDFQHQVKLQSDQNVMEFIGKGVRTEPEVLQWLEKQIAHNEKHGFATGLLSLRDGTVIGRAGIIYLDYDDTQEKIEFGYALMPEYWGNGYATEISMALIDFAFQDPDVATVYATTHQGNEASAHVLQKCGLVLVGNIAYSIGKAVDFYKIDRKQ